MKVDAHQHFWQYDPVELDWMTDAHGAIRRDFTPVDLKACLDTVGFDGSVAVQARQMVEETEFLLAYADTYRHIQGVVGWVDLRSDDVTDQLDVFSEHPKLKGVRHVVHDEPDDYFMDGKAFRNGISLLADYNLTYDLLLFPKHVPVATRLVDGFPNLKFVVDHIAKPDIAQGVMEPWRTEMRCLGEREQVACKLSGMVTEADLDAWRPEDFTPYLDVMLEIFGPKRLMIGSDWPVSLLGGEYPEVMGIVIDYVQRLSTDEQNSILGETCIEFYNL